MCPRKEHPVKQQRSFRCYINCICNSTIHFSAIHHLFSYFSYFWMSQLPPLGLNFMAIGLSLLPTPHSGRHIRLCATLAAFKTSFFLKYIFLRKLTRCDCVPYCYISHQICSYYLHWFFTFSTSLYQLCQSLVIIEWYILMLYHNCITLLYFIALYVLHLFYVQRWRTLRFGTTQINKLLLLLHFYWYGSNFVPPQLTTIAIFHHISPCKFWRRL